MTAAKANDCVFWEALKS